MLGGEGEGATSAACDGRSSRERLTIWPPHWGQVAKSTPVNARCWSCHVCCGGLAWAGLSLAARRRWAAASLVWTLLLACRP